MDRGGESAMRQDLVQWLDIALKPAEIIEDFGDAKSVSMINPQNRRMVRNLLLLLLMLLLNAGYAITFTIRGLLLC